VGSLTGHVDDVTYSYRKHGDFFATAGLMRFKGTCCFLELNTYLHRWIKR